MTRKHIVVAGLLLVAVAVGLGFFWPFHGDHKSLLLPGVVEIQEVHLGSKVGGRVAEVKILEGDLVEPGQPLVIFEVPELRAQLEQAQGRLRAAEADLDRARNGPRTEEKDAARAAVESAKARWERLKAGSRPEEIDQGRHDLESAQADLKLSQEDFDRADRLYRQSTISHAEFDSARATLERMRGRERMAQARLNLLLAGSRVEEIDEAAAEQRRAEANYRLLLAGTRSEDIAEAEGHLLEARGKVAELEADLRESMVSAPEKAVVQVLAVRKGDLVTPNQPVLRILRADDLWVRVYVPETQLGKVHVGQDAAVTVDTFPGKRFAGKVIQVSSESEFTPRNVQSAEERRHQVFGVKVHVEDPQGVFKSGMAAEVTLPVAD